MAKSPWISMWFSPRETIQSLLKTQPKKGFWWLGFIFAFPLFSGNFFLLFSSQIEAKVVFVQLLWLLLFSLLGGALFLLIETALAYFSCRLFKGKAPWLHVRCAVSWSKLPIFLLFFTQGIFFPPFLSQSSLWVVGIWVITLWFINISEAQKFSIAKTLGSFCVYLVLVFLLSFLVGMIIGLINLSTHG